MTATIVGIAVAEGLLTLDQTVGELLLDRIPPTADPRAASVTVEQLLTMTSGLAWSSSTDYQFAFDEVDMTARALGLPMVCDPGACYEYNSGNVQVLSSMVQAAAGMTLAEYAQPRLFEPLGIPTPVWEASVTGETLGAVGLHLTPRDFAKIGYLYLNDGIWDGQQILPAAWVDAATSVQSSGANATGVNLGLASYGYLWWVTEVGGLPAYFALGLSSQMLYVVPDLDLVVVATTSNAIPYEVPIPQQQDPRPIIEALVVCAATGPVAAEDAASPDPWAVSPGVELLPNWLHSVSPASAAHYRSLAGKPVTSQAVASLEPISGPSTSGPGDVANGRNDVAWDEAAIVIADRSRYVTAGGQPTEHARAASA